MLLRDMFGLPRLRAGMRQHFTQGAHLRVKLLRQRGRSGQIPQVQLLKVAVIQKMVQHPDLVGYGVVLRQEIIHGIGHGIGHGAPL
nr:MAG TPA: hypothetical protein [Caudoviricetes sp.]